MARKSDKNSVEELAEQYSQLQDDYEHLSALVERGYPLRQERDDLVDKMSMVNGKIHEHGYLLGSKRRGAFFLIPMEGTES